MFIGLAGGYYLAFQGDRTLGFAAPGMDRTDLLNNDDVAISNVRFVDSDVSDGTLGLRFEAVRPVQIMGPVDDPEIQRILTFAVLNEQNPGVRLRAVNAVSTSERLHSDFEIRDALVTALKTDSNAGVRGEAFNALSRYPFDEEIRDAMIYALMFDDNAALRISAINRLQEQGPALFDENLERVLRTRMVLDENAYIRTKARTVLSNLSAP
ncbi:MAG: HEAT repeat domain-containing protein [Gemmatimonadota bacterium]|nr:HEAT repeat domain-containing protein [Gemmatimonadota bacterium]